jgi:uncharacterized protein with HEPN domain
MSSREWLFRLQDILQAIEKIEGYLKKSTYSQFIKNEMVFDAVVRNLEIIGEASRNIPANIRQAHPDIPWELMYGMRNVLIHQYFGVDIQVVWHTAKTHLPPVQKKLEQILAEIAK